MDEWDREECKRKYIEKYIVVCRILRKCGRGVWEFDEK